jgi:hypothetical protein
MAELIAIERALRSDSRGEHVNLVLIAEHHLKSLSEGLQNRFTMIASRPGASALGALFACGELGNFDALLSSFDSASVFFGWFYRIPVFMYDGLFWFWDFDRHKYHVNGYLAELQAIRDRRDAIALQEMYQRLVETDYHLTMLLAYHLCNHAFARDGVGTSSRLTAHPEFNKKVSVVGAVIDTTLREMDANQRSHILVSLSGSLAPLLTFSQNLVYARGALEFAKDAHQTINELMHWHFCCHPLLYEALQNEGYLRNLPDSFSVEASFDYRKNLEMIRCARALFISPGLSSIQEAAFFRTPVFLLPEQNGGQPAQVKMLRESGYDTSHNWTVTEVLREGRLDIREHDVAELYQAIDLLWSKRLRPDRVNAIRKFSAVLRDETQRMELVERQRSGVLSLLGNFHGASQVADVLLANLT